MMKKWLRKSFLILGLGWLGYSFFLITRQSAILKSLLVAILFISFSVLPTLVKKTKEELNKQAKERRMNNIFTPSVNQSKKWQ